MNTQAMTRQNDVGLFAAIRKVPPHYLFGVMLFALLWLVNEYFVPRKEYEKDQGRIESKLNEMSGDIKQILKGGVK